jgi:nonribosomal peptide synthetase DhbF
MGDHLMQSSGASTEFPLSAAQLGLWFGQQLDPQNAAFNVGDYLEILGPIDPAQFEATLRQVICETELLRIRLVERAGEPCQIIAAPAEWSLPFFDVSGEADPTAAALSWMRADLQRPTDLLRDPLFAFALFKAKADRFLWYARYHHIVIDGLSASLIARRVADFYTALARGSRPDASAVGPLTAIIAEDAAYRASDDFARDRQFWIEYLDGATDPTSITGGHFVQSRGVLRRTVHLHAPGVARLRAIGRLSRVVTAATALLVHRLARAEDILLGFAVAARSDATRSAAGAAANVVPLRLKVDPGARVRDIVAETDRQIRAVLPHQRYRFTDLRRDLGRIGDDRPIYSPVVNIFPFDFEFRFAGAPASFSNLSTGPVEDLSIVAYDNPRTAELRIDLDAEPRLHSADALSRHGQRLLRLLEAMADADATIGHLEMLTPDERHQVLVEWNLTQADYPTERFIDELFASQAERTPEHTAAVFEHQRLSYAELNRRADELAGRLRALGVGPDVLVALFVERSLEMVVGMLGVLKAGGAYVPLDPTHPRNRLAGMLADAQPAVLLTHRRLRSRLPPHQCHVVAIDDDAPTAVPVAHQPAANRTRNPRDLAYVIYTSGSTGEPKGVEIEHRSVVNLLASMLRQPALSAEDTMLAITTLGFDIAALEIFLPLTRGACVVIAAGETINDGAALAGLIVRCDPTVMQATPATLRMLLDAGWGGSPRLKILCGGEAWTAELANQLLPRCASLWNMYGPTETTVWSGVAKVEADRPIVIGPPIANTRFYVLDRALQPVPVGVPGELYIGGDGLARGYRRRPELTRECFVTDPFAAKIGARMYRTGDLVRRLPDGTFEFLGRLDHQVKIRGHRIELGEIEAALERHPAVKHCVVIASDDVRGERRLVAYAIPSAGSVVPTGDLRRLLSETVPAYMIPAAFVPLSSFPLTPSGKVNRKALPPPDGTAHEADVASLAPRNPTEEVIARLWCDVLNLRKVSVRDNFFELGGNSLLAVRVIFRINAALRTKLGVSAMFVMPTIEALAASIERNRQAGDRGPQVISFQTGHTGPPLYFIGAGPAEYRIAQTIGENRAIFAIDMPIPVDWLHAITTPDRPFPTMEQLAALYGDAVRAHAGSSPCVVVGYSFSGKIAFEAARVLQRAGGNLAVVLLIDTFAWGGAPGMRTYAWQNLLRIWRGAPGGTAIHTSYIGRLSISLVNSWRLMWWVIAQIPGRMKQRAAGPQEPAPLSVDTDGMPVEWAVAERLYRILQNSFHPRPLEASGLLFRAGPGENTLPGHDFTNGWRHLFTRGLTVVHTKGDHASIVHDEQDLVALAQGINAALDEYDRLKPSCGGLALAGMIAEN